MVSYTAYETRRNTVLITYSGYIKCDCRHVIDRFSQGQQTTISHLPFPPPSSVAPEFKDTPSAARDRLMAAFSRSVLDRQTGISKTTNKKQAGSFDRWTRFVQGMRISKEWLDGYTRQQKKISYPHLLAAVDKMS